MRYLITGGSGYFGGELKRSLLRDGHTCINLDICKDADVHPNLVSENVDISNLESLEAVFKKHGRIDCVFHVAAQLQLTRKTRKNFYKTNIDATRFLAEQSIANGIKNFVYISSNCVYGRVNETSITEDYPLQPFEEYGKSKVISEKILQEYRDKLHVVSLRPPTIIGIGRLGVLSIVFDFIQEGRKIWLVGSGENRYQFIYSDDLIQACKLAANHSKSATFNVGCDDVPTLNQLFNAIIRKANSQSTLYHLPPGIAIPAMKFAFKFGLSPLGPYQYNMITNSFIGDTKKIKHELNWRPTQSNIEIMQENYQYYTSNKIAICQNKSLSGHRKLGKPGILSFIKWIS